MARSWSLTAAWWSQQFCVGLDVGEHATDIGGLLRRHAAMLRDRSGFHSSDALASLRCASDRSTGLMEIISTEEWRGAAPWTMIIVATRRKLGNESPSIISSSVITSYAPDGSSRSTPLIRKGCLK